MTPGGMRATASRDRGDEAYTVGLCNQVLGEQALIQHRFDWLSGAPERDLNTN